MAITSPRATTASLVPLRAALGSAMLIHGTSKLKPDGLAQTAQFFEQLNIRPGKPWAVATGMTETAVGTMTLLGVGTRLAALGVLITQGMAVARVHWKKGYDVAGGGFEYNLALMAIAAAVALVGPGRLSLHELLEARGRRRLVRNPFRRRTRTWLRALFAVQ